MCHAFRRADWIHFRHANEASTSLRRHGFSLVELIVVMAIVSVLVAMLLPALAKSREASRRMICASHLHQSFLGMLGYSMDYQDWAPGPSYWADDPSIDTNSSRCRTNARPYVGGTWLNSPRYSTAWWTLVNELDYIAPSLIACPSMEYEVEGTAGRPSGWIHYSYRFNSKRAAYSAGSYPYIRGALNNPHRDSIALVTDAADYRRSGTGQIHTTWTAWNQQQWAHLDGGNVLAHGGHVRFKQNWLNTSAPYSFPNNNSPRWSSIDNYLAR